VRLPWLIHTCATHMCAMTHSCVCNSHLGTTFARYVWMLVCVITHLYVCHDSIYVCRDSSTRVPWLTCVARTAGICNDPFMWVPWRIHTHESFILLQEPSRRRFSFIFIYLCEYIYWNTHTPPTNSIRTGITKSASANPDLIASSRWRERCKGPQRREWLALSRWPPFCWCVHTYTCVFACLCMRVDICIYVCIDKGLMHILYMSYMNKSHVALCTRYVFSSIYVTICIVCIYMHSLYMQRLMPLSMSYMNESHVNLCTLYTYTSLFVYLCTL